MSRCRSIALAIVAVLTLALQPIVAYAWDELGHETVARIAWERMTPATRTRALMLLRSASADAGVRDLDDPTRPATQRDRELFMRAATWADRVRDHAFPERATKYHHAPWHYRDRFWQQDTPGGPIVDRPEIEPSPRGENAVAVLDASAKSLGDVSRPDSLKAIDLLWVMHLVGDVHQPLHASARITPLDPGGDNGGNRFRLYPPGSSGTGLHSFWDGAITRHDPRSASDSTLDAYVSRVATTIMQAHPVTTLATRLQPVDFDRWTTESLEIAKRELFPTSLVRNQPPDGEYDARAGTIAEERVALAGYRLAEVLNVVLK